MNNQMNLLEEILFENEQALAVLDLMHTLFAEVIREVPEVRSKTIDYALFSVITNLAENNKRIDQAIDMARSGKGLSAK